MKQLLIITLLTFSSVTLADTFTNIRIDSVKLDGKMNLIMNVRMSNPCDQTALPQIIQDEQNPTVFKVQAMARQANVGCISIVPPEKQQIVSLPALLEATATKLQKLTNYTFKFEGSDSTLTIPGDRLMTSIQPDFQAE